VFDEADNMLQAEGFMEDSVRLIKTIRKRNPSVSGWSGGSEALGRSGWGHKSQLERGQLEI
jgi:hypothetical protein